MSGVNIQSELTKLKSSNIGDRKNAAWILGDTGDKRVVDPLINTLKIEPDRFVRMNIVKALAKINDKRALAILKVLKDKDPDTKVRKEASWAYFKIKEEPSKKAETKATRTIMKVQKKPSGIAHKTPPPIQPKKVVPKKPLQMREKSSSVQKSSKPLMKSKPSTTTKTIAKLPAKTTTTKSPSSIKPSSSKSSLFGKKPSQSTTFKKPTASSTKPTSSIKPVTSKSTMKQIPKTSTTKTVVKMPSQPVKKVSSDSQKDKSKQQFLKPRPVEKKKK